MHKGGEDRNDRKVSSHWPDYFRADLAVGTDGVAPLASALDQTSLRASDRGLFESYAVRPDRWPVDRARRALEALGFPVVALDDAEVRALYGARADILAGRGSLRSLRGLATVYLGPCDVRRGSATVALPLPAEGATQLTVADAPSRFPTVVIRMATKPVADRVSSFLRAVTVVVPEGTRVRVYPQRRSVTAERSGFPSAVPTRLSERRI